MPIKSRFRTIFFQKFPKNIVLGVFFSKNSIKSHFGPKNDNFWPKNAKKTKKRQLFCQKMAKKAKKWGKRYF